MSTATGGPSAPPPSANRSTGGAPRVGNSGWVTGMVLFAGVVMMVNGILEIFQGIMAIAEDDVFVKTPKYIFQFDLTGWGWIHLIIGVLVAVTGFGVIRGASWARIVGIFLASLSMISAFLSLPYYPLWSLVVVALDVFVIWALCIYRED
ncbi:hypothetical protein ACGFX4_13080 [Kitasatospora sp. NPDC048365]|uniref:DUF7144 domain-containing protein n=1 Tax=Kitasatospora terrestris TaxID=258051 RepID=A0ABP9DHU1_9ACTN